MADIQELEANVSEVETINGMSGVLRDIAAQRMQEMRGDFERNRMYYDEVRALFAMVRRLMQKRFDMSRENTNNRDLAIAVTSNYRFFGGLNREVVEKFLSDFSEYDEHIVVGDTGAQYVSNTEYFEQCEFKNFPEDTPSHTELWSLVQRFRSYDTVTIYYPRFKNPFQQVPSAVDINATPDVSLDREPEEFIAEPNLPLVHDFFLTQIKWIIFRRLLLETELSRVAARMVKMHSAEETSDEIADDLRRRIRREERERRDVQLFESIIGLQQWRAKHHTQ